MKKRAAALAFVVALVGVLALAGSAAAQDDSAAIFASAVASLHQGRPGDAIAQLEALADRGVVDPVASYDRGLAYATRVRIGAELPGDLGRAAHGFEEARELSHDPRLIEDATRALTVVRSEVARRRTRAGEPVDVDAGRSLARAIAHLASEDTWAACAAAFSAALAAGLFVRWLSRASRARTAGGIGAGVAAPLLGVAVAMTLASRHDRTALREAVVVSAEARPTNDRGIAVPGGARLPEGARVEIVDSRAAQTRVRFGMTDVWLSTNALRELASAQ
jgi:hypothetical protein